MNSKALNGVSIISNLSSHVFLQENIGIAMGNAVTVHLHHPT